MQQTPLAAVCIRLPHAPMDGMNEFTAPDYWQLLPASNSHERQDGRLDMFRQLWPSGYDVDQIRR